MDAHLKRLADVSLRLESAEESLAAGAYTGAREALDAAGEGLDELRAGWPEMNAGERAVVGRTAAPLRDRLDTARARLPRATALSEGEPEHDPEAEEEPPGGAA